MESPILTTEIEGKGLYYYLTKYAVPAGLIICITVLLMDYWLDPRSGIPNDRIFINLCIAIIPLSLCQLVLSIIFPHRVLLFKNHLRFLGPWKMSRIDITYDNLKIVEFNDEVLCIKPKWPGITKVYIMRSLDPDKQIQDILLKRLKSYPHVSVKQNAMI